MDIEGFVRARIDDYDYDDLADILAVRIREYKKISEENSLEMAKAVIDEVSTTLKLQESDDEFLKEIASVNKADVLMGEMGVGSRGAGDFFVHRKIAEIVSSTNTASLVNPSEQDDGGVVKAPVNNDEVYITQTGIFRISVFRRISCNSCNPKGCLCYGSGSCSYFK